LLGILNSKVVRFYLDAIVSKVRGGYFSMSKSYVETIPIVYPQNTNPFVHLVKEIIDLKKKDSTADTSDLESQINQMVYELYGLTEEEIAIVEGNK
jgi:adenine-specific DNA-methyltransferase